MHGQLTLSGRTVDTGGPHYVARAKDKKDLAEVIFPHAWV
jgi:hypothetical protein